MYQKHIKAYSNASKYSFVKFYKICSSASPDQKIPFFKRIDFYRKMHVFFYKNNSYC